MSEPRLFYQQPGLNTECYDELTAQGGPGVAGDVSYYLRHAQRVGGPVLELGAGTGRVTWALAAAGVEVVGLDLSEAMLERAWAKALDLPAAVRERAHFLLGDMSRFDLGRKFWLVIIPFRAFQSLTSPDDQRRALECVARHLHRGGRLIVDLFDPRLDLCLPDAPPDSKPQSVKHPASGRRVVVEIVARTTDPLHQVLTEVWRFKELDDAGSVLRVEDERLTLRWTYRWEMRYLLELTGFEVVAEYSDFHESPPAYGQEQVWIARRS